MGVFTSQLTAETEVRMDRMRPAQVDAAREKFPAIYVPFGSIEWHGWQSPLGLDGTKAHEQLVGLAMRSGGVVYPMVPMGVGGGHGGFPHTFMVAPEPMQQIALELLRAFERQGYKAAILLSGHYPNRLDFLNGAILEYRKAGGAMDVLALIDIQIPGTTKCCHGGLLESSLMLYLHPETMDMSAIDGEPSDDIGAADEKKDWLADEHKDHPCYGIVGIDPRGRASARLGEENTDILIAWLQRWLAGEVDLDIAGGAWQFAELPSPHTSRCI